MSNGFAGKKRGREVVSMDAPSFFSLQNTKVDGGVAHPNQDRVFAQVLPLSVDFSFDHCQGAIKAICGGAQQVFEKLDMPGGSTFTGAVLVGDQVLLFNVGDSKTCIGKIVDSDDERKIEMVAETQEHTPGLDNEHLNLVFLDLANVELCFDPDDFKDADGGYYSGLVLFRAEDNKLVQMASVNDINKGDSRIYLSMRAMSKEDRAALLKKLSLKTIDLSAFEGASYDPAYYKLKVFLHVKGKIVMTRALGDHRWEQVRHDLDFNLVRLKRGSYIVAALTDGVTDVCKVFDKFDDCPHLREVLTSVLNDERLTRKSYSEILCDFVISHWTEQSPLSARDDISAGVVFHDTSSAAKDEMQVVFAADGHGVKGEIISATLKYLMQHLFVPYMDFLQSPSQDKRDIVIEKIVPEMFDDFAFEKNVDGSFVEVRITAAEQALCYKSIFSEMMSALIAPSAATLFKDVTYHAAAVAAGCGAR